MEEYGQDMPGTLNSFLNWELFGCVYVVGNPLDNNYMCLFDTTVDMNLIREDNFEEYANKVFMTANYGGMFKPNISRI